MLTIADSLAGALADARERTLLLVSELPGPLLERSAAPYMGPIGWDLAHLAWFEELWLLRRLHGAEPTDPAFDRMLDASRAPRRERERAGLPPRREILGYMERVRARVVETLEASRTPRDERGRRLAENGLVHRMVLQHEIQHQETILQALDLFGERLGPVGLPLPHAAHGEVKRGAGIDDEARVVVETNGVVEIGTGARAGVYDNERPRHERPVAPFVIDRYPVTNRRFAAFVEDGGYTRTDCWSPEGLAWREKESVRAPGGWRPERGALAALVFGVEVQLDPLAPVQHVSWYEADAFARWDGGRLPTEFEWEAAATSGAPLAAANVGWRARGPLAVGSFPGSRTPHGVEQALGDVYEWTASSFDGYPGFEAFPYDEYSKVFFGGRYRVLRGASWAVHEPMVRTTYRNWDLPQRRQLFAGCRVARDMA